MTPGGITACILILQQVYAPLFSLGMNYREIRQSFIDMEQMLELLAVAPEIVDAPNARPLPPASERGAELAFEHVDFRHSARSVGLSDVSFTHGARDDDRSGWTVGRRQDHDRAAGAAADRSSGRAGAARRTRSAGGEAAIRCARPSPWCLRTSPCSTTPSGRTSPLAIPTRARRRCGRPPRRPNLLRFIESLAAQNGDAGGRAWAEAFRRRAPAGRPGACASGQPPAC